MRCGAIFRLALSCAVLTLAACAVPPSVPPSAEFLVATPDSAYWVKTGADGVRVRGVPMTLVVYEGQYHEAYVANVDQSYTDAIFVGERLFQRNLITGDSTMVLDDAAILAAANRYARETPSAQRLAADDPDPEQPIATGLGETDILSVRGPYVLLERRATIESPSDQRYDTTRVAVDMRSARVVPLNEVRRASVVDSATANPLPFTWRRGGYDLVARGDSESGMVSFLLRDARQRTWPVLTVSSPPRVYWLDRPAVDGKIRRALAHAFNEAAMYDENVRFASYQRRKQLRDSSASFPIFSL